MWRYGFQVPERRITYLRWLFLNVTLSSIFCWSIKKKSNVHPCSKFRVRTIWNFVWPVWYRTTMAFYWDFKSFFNARSILSKCFIADVYLLGPVPTQIRGLEQGRPGVGQLGRDGAHRHCHPGWRSCFFFLLVPWFLAVFRIRMGSGFNKVSGSGSGSRRAKITPESRRRLRNIMFLSAELKASSVQ